MRKGTTWFKAANIIVVLVLASASLGEVSPLGTWAGTFWSDSDSTLELTSDGKVKGSFFNEEGSYTYFTSPYHDSDSWGGTYSYNNDTRKITFDGKGWLLTIIYSQSMGATTLSQQHG